MHQGEHVGRLDIVNVEQVGLGVGIGNFVGQARAQQGSAQGVEAEVSGSHLDDHGLRRRIGEGNQPHLLGRVLHLAHKGESGAVFRGALRLGDEVAAAGKARLILGIVNASEPLRANFTARERTLQGANVRHGYLPLIHVGVCSGRTLRWFASDIVASWNARRKPCRVALAMATPASPFITGPAR